MLHKLRQRASDERGFTLIELLVVILIIGILAAIALPSFLGQRSKAQDTEAKTTARTAQTAMETWYTDRQTYAGATPALLKSEIEDSLPTNAAAAGKLSLAITDLSGTAYTVEATSVTGNKFKIVKDATAGTVLRTCTKVASKGSCTTDGGAW